MLCLCNQFLLRHHNWLPLLRFVGLPEQAGNKKEKLARIPNSPLSLFYPLIKQASCFMKHVHCILIQKIFFQFFLLKIISIALSRENLFYSGQKFYERMWITFLCRFYCVVSRLYHYRKTQFQLDLSWIGVIMKASNHELSPAHKNIPLTYKEMKSTKGDVSFWGLRSILACYLPWPHGL